MYIQKLFFCHKIKLFMFKMVFFISAFFFQETYSSMIIFDQYPDPIGQYFQNRIRNTGSCQNKPKSYKRFGHPHATSSNMVFGGT